MPEPTRTDQAKQNHRQRPARPRPAFFLADRQERCEARLRCAVYIAWDASPIGTQEGYRSESNPDAGSGRARKLDGLKFFCTKRGFHR